MNDRIRRIHADMARLRAELAGVENGTLLLLEERGEVTPSDVMEVLGCSQQTANNRLQALLRAGFADRIRIPVPGGGKAFSYSRRVS